MVINFGQVVTGRETGWNQRRPNVSRWRLKFDRLRPGGDHRIPARNRWWLPGIFQRGGRVRRAPGIPEFGRIGVKINKESEVGQ